MIIAYNEQDSHSCENQPQLGLCMEVRVEQELNG